MNIFIDFSDGYDIFVLKFLNRSFSERRKKSIIGLSLFFLFEEIHGSPDSRVRNVHTCQVLRLRRAAPQLAK